jgi:hypothetical protein
MAQTRAQAAQFAAVLEDIATHGLPDSERHLIGLARERPAVG